MANSFSFTLTTVRWVFVCLTTTYQLHRSCSIKYGLGEWRIGKTLEQKGRWQFQKSETLWKSVKNVNQDAHYLCWESGLESSEQEPMWWQPKRKMRHCLVLIFLYSKQSSLVAEKINSWDVRILTDIHEYTLFLLLNSYGPQQILKIWLWILITLHYFVSVHCFTTY